MTTSKPLSRIKQFGEVFTPIALVNEMLDKLPIDCWDCDKTFIDNSCGNGNFLVEILKRKLALRHEPLQALSTIYGVELLEDNTLECKHRLIELIEDKEKAQLIVDKNIVCADALKYDYTFGD